MAEIIGGHDSKSYSWGTGETWARNTVTSKSDATTQTYTVSADTTSGNAYTGSSMHHLSGYGVFCRVGWANKTDGGAAWIANNTGTYSRNNKVAACSGSVTFTKKKYTQSVEFYTAYWGQTVNGNSAASNSGFITSARYTVPALASYTVSYNANGGSGAPGNQTKWYGETLTLSSTVPTRGGYTFQGWSDGTNTYWPGGTYTGNSALSLTAQWTLNSYVITYNANGGSGGTLSQTKWYGETVNLQGAWSRTNYTQTGWNTAANGTGTSYGLGASFSGNYGMTLYAQWSENTYTVSYDANGGSGAPAAQTKYATTNLTLSSQIPTRSQYVFLGWATSAGGSVVYSAGATYSSNANITLYAVWKLDVVYISYNANTSDSVGNMPSKSGAINAGSTGTVDSAKPTRKFYSFKGWGLSSGATVASYQPGNQTAALTSDLTLYALWTSAYTRPQISNAAVTRCDENGDPADEGEYALVTFGWSTSSTADSTGETYPAKSVTCTFNGESDDGLVSTLAEDSDTANGKYSGSYSHVFSGASTESSYPVVISVADSANTTTTTLTLPSVELWIDCSPSGGVAIRGIAPDENTFKVYSDTAVLPPTVVEGEANINGSLTAGSANVSGDLTVGGTTTIGDCVKILDDNIIHLDTWGNEINCGLVRVLSHGSGYVDTLVAAKTVDGSVGISYSNGNLYFTHNNSSNTQTSCGNLSFYYSGTYYPWEMIYPVGAVYISYVSTSPASLFGGSWTQITGVLRAARDTGTGGSDTHTLSWNEMPSHTHSYDRLWTYNSSSPQGAYGSGGFWFSFGSGTQTASAGSNYAHNNLPYYQNVYAWRRTA